MFERIQLSALAFIFLLSPAVHSASLSPTEAEAAAKAAYIYGYPLVLMETVKQQETNVLSPDDHHAPINQFRYAPTLYQPGSRTQVLPNIDTLYSTAWLDLAEEPMVLSVPDSNNRYYILELIDAWTNVFAAPGQRTTGTSEQDFVIVGPNWRGQLPEQLEQIHSPTNMVWLIGRIQVSHPHDFTEVRTLQRLFKLRPLSAWRAGSSSPVLTSSGSVNPAVDMKTTAQLVVARMDMLTFYALLARSMAVNPPAPEDANLLRRMQMLGIEPGKPFSTKGLSPVLQQAISRGYRAGSVAVWQRPKHAYREANGWYWCDKTGHYGTEYEVRAHNAATALGENQPDDAIYPEATRDSSGQKLNGKNKYRIHFAKGETPPARAFWSITLYGMDNYLVKNKYKRYAIGDRDPLEYNVDGSVDIYIQADSPGAAKESNWLPAPKGDFKLLMRIYWPEEEVLSGEWVPPPIKIVKTSFWQKVKNLPQ
jgi:hypothetical protein